MYVFLYEDVPLLLNFVGQFFCGKTFFSPYYQRTHMQDMYLQVYNLNAIQHVIVLLKEIVSETWLLNQACIKYGWGLTM
jgi:hypothetical protein